MSGWCEKQVKELGKIVTGWTPSTKRKDFYDGDYNLISPADLDNGKYIRTAHRGLRNSDFSNAVLFQRIRCWLDVSAMSENSEW